MARKTPKADAPKRKLGERTEMIETKLTPMQIEDERAIVIDLLQEKDTLEEAWKSRKADHKAKIAEIDSRRETALGMIRSGKVRREIVIEEWVTDRNEVIRVEKATGEEIGRRNATARELQEDLPLDTTPPAPKVEEDDGEAEHAREVAEDQAGEGDDAGDFGDKA